MADLVSAENCIQRPDRQQKLEEEVCDIGNLLVMDGTRLTIFQLKKTFRSITNRTSSLDRIVAELEGEATRRAAIFGKASTVLRFQVQRSFMR